MNGLITTNEPKAIKDLLIDLIPCPMPFDIMLYTKSGKIPIERKKCPGDFLSSIEDGRLGREIIAMREESPINIVLLHKKFSFNPDGTLKGKFSSRHWTKKSISNIKRTLMYVECCYIETAETDQELVSVLNDIQEYMDDKVHTSIKGRPGIIKEWIRPTYEERVRHFYSGLPGIATIRAQKLRERFPLPIDLLGASIDDIDKVRGFGKTDATELYNFLRGIK